MEYLHAYWRMAYIKAKKRGNPFANLASMDDKEALIIYRGKHNLILLNKFPYTAGHLLILPCKEVAELEDLSEDEFTEHMHLIIKAKDILKKGIEPHG